MAEQNAAARRRLGISLASWPQLQMTKQLLMENSGRGRQPMEVKLRGPSDKEARTGWTERAQMSLRSRVKSDPE